jgi:hypothetical protein
MVKAVIGRTPGRVMDAISTIAVYLHEEGLKQAIISNEGGCSFRLDNIFDRLEALHVEIDELKDRCEGVHGAAPRLDKP